MTRDSLPSYPLEAHWGRTDYDLRQQEAQAACQGSLDQGATCPWTGNHPRECYWPINAFNLHFCSKFVPQIHQTPWSSSRTYPWDFIILHCLHVPPYQPMLCQLLFIRYLATTQDPFPICQRSPELNPHLSHPTRLHESERHSHCPQMCAHCWWPPTHCQSLSQFNPPWQPTFHCHAYHRFLWLTALRWNDLPGWNITPKLKEGHKTEHCQHPRRPIWFYITWPQSRSLFWRQQNHYFCPPLQPPPSLPFWGLIASWDMLHPIASPLWLMEASTIPTQSFFINHLHLFFKEDIAGQSTRAGGATALAEHGVSSTNGPPSFKLWEAGHQKLSSSTSAKTPPFSKVFSTLHRAPLPLPYPFDSFLSLYTFFVLFLFPLSLTCHFSSHFGFLLTCVLLGHSQTSSYQLWFLVASPFPKKKKRIIFFVVVPVCAINVFLRLSQQTSC